MASTITNMKVLGTGCKTCHAQLNHCKSALAELGICVEVEYVTDMERIIPYGVMVMPAIVVNEKVLAAGKLLKPKDVIKLLQKNNYC